MKLTDGENLRVARLINELTLEDMGKILMCVPTHVAQVEKGTRNLSRIRQERIKPMLIEAERWYTSIIESIDSHVEDMSWNLRIRKLLHQVLKIKKESEDIENSH